MLVIKNKKSYKEWIKHKNQKEKPKPQNGSNNNIYIDCVWTDYLAAFLPRFMYAEGLYSENKNSKLYAICNEIDQNVSEIADAYGINVVNIRKKKSLIKAILLTIQLFLFKNNEKSIYSLKYHSVDVGKYLADVLIRHSDDLFSVNKIRTKDLKNAILFFWFIVEFGENFKKRRPSIYLVLETGYWNGPAIRIAENYGSKIIQCLSGNRVIEIGDKTDIPINPIDLWNYGVHKSIDIIDKKHIDYKKWAEEYYGKRRLGLTDKDAADAYANKTILSRNEWLKESGADKNKKNIVIMAHCFSDDANTTTSRSIYRDYYQWLVETLKIIQGVDNVNWLLRAHPGRGFYNEGDFVYEVFNKYAIRDNIYVLDDNISSESLYDIIDGAVTVLGTCGLEFSSFGIPVVCAGLASYGGFGFTLEPLTAQDYKECLRNMDKINKLSDEKIDMARKVSYAYFNLRNPADIFDEVFEDSLNMDSGEANDYVIEKLNYLRKSGIPETESFFYKSAKR